MDLAHWILVVFALWLWFLGARLILRRLKEANEPVLAWVVACLSIIPMVWGAAMLVIGMRYLYKKARG